MRDLTVPEIETALRSLDLEVPDADLAPAVVAAVAGAPRRRTTLRPVLVAAALLAAAVVAVTAIEPAREAVADWLGIGGTRIEVVDEQPDLAGLPPTVSVLGERTTARQAEQRLGASPRLPAAVGAPEAWFADGAAVSAVWRADDGLPDLSDSGLGLVLTQRTIVDEDTVAAFKQIGPDVVAQSTEVRGDLAMWVEGPHLRTAVAGRPTVAANVLLWIADGVEYRLESNLGLAGAVAVAESIG